MAKDTALAALAKEIAQVAALAEELTLRLDEDERRRTEQRRTVFEMLNDRTPQERRDDFKVFWGTGTKRTARRAKLEIVR